MTTEVISYVGSAVSWTAFSASQKAYYTDTGGSNYTTPQLWDNAFGNTSGDLVTDDEIAAAELNAEDFIGALIIRADWTTDPTHYPVIRARAGSEYNHVDDTGVKIWRNAYYGITVNSAYTRFQRVRIGSYSYPIPIDAGGDNTIDCRSCTILSSDIIASRNYYDLYYRGCLVLFAPGAGVKLQYINLLNCTIICDNSQGLTAMYKNAYNTVIYNASAVLSFANFYLQWLGDYNAESVSDQGDPPGANSIINLPSSAFKNYAGGDYTLSGTTSELYHAGSSAYAPELDNNGVPFDALTPSIGAFEFIPTPQTATPPAFELGTFKPQQGDISLFQTDDGGDITALDGIVTMGGGLETAVYLSLFGGNEDDDGRQDSPADWWGNIDETDPAREYHSETQHLLRSLPATTGNLRRLEDAARRDLSWLESDSVASSVTVSASIPGVNKIKLEIDIEAIGEESSFEYVENWKADA